MKDIKDYEGLYAITEDGRIWSYRSNRFLKPYVRKGYLRVKLYINGVEKDFSIHRLVAFAYLPNPDNLPEVNHKDENKQNNCVDNLEWVTHQENMNYGTRNERISKAQGKAVLCVELNTVFHSLNEAARQLKIDPSSISKACRGELKTCGGFHWEFVKTN